MRIFYAVSDIPAAGHRLAGAVSVVTYQAAAALRELGHDVAVQPILAGRTSLSDEERRDFEALARAGLRAEEPLLVPPPSPRRLGLVREAATGSAADFFPALVHADDVRRRVAAHRADLVLHVWSPEALAACSRADPPVYAYYGNPDHKPVEARLKHPELFDVRLSHPRRTLLRLANERRRRANVALMQTCTWAGNVCAVDAEFYAAEGHRDAFYVQNMWSDSGVDGPGEPRGRALIGSMGSMRATGNTFGLDFLGREVVPALVHRLGDGFTVDVCGGGSPYPAVARALDHPCVRMRGWVDDIDGELRAARAFLLVNNNHPDFVVGHTRLLHAWSLGCCVIAHRGIALAMPEAVHGENVLLGETGAEIADLVAAVFADDALRERIARGGLETFRRDFLPQVVTRRILEKVGA